MHPRNILLILTLLGVSCLAIANNQTVITNIRTLTMQAVEDVPRMDVCADLTRCQYVGKEFDVTVLDHDSLTSVVFPDRRYDFTTRGDTALLVCEEMRAARLSFPEGLVFTIGSDNAYFSNSVIGQGRYRQSYNISAGLSATIFPASASSIITTHCDTLTNIRFDHIRRITRFALIEDSVPAIVTIPDSMIVTSTVDTYFLTAIDEDFPRVLKRVNVLSGSNVVIADSATYILVSNPIKNSPAKQRQLPHKRNNTHLTDDGPTVTVAPDGSSVTISPYSQNIEMSVVVSDVSGRVFIVENISGNDYYVVDISQLPRGDYLIQVIADDETAQVVKFTNR